MHPLKSAMDDKNLKLQSEDLPEICTNNRDFALLGWLSTANIWLYDRFGYVRNSRLHILILISKNSIYCTKWPFRDVTGKLSLSQLISLIGSS